MMEKNAYARMASPGASSRNKKNLQTVFKPTGVEPPSREPSSETETSLKLLARAQTPPKEQM